MSCCGYNHNSWNRETGTRRTQAPVNFNINRSAGKWFEYTGPQKLAVKGSSGKLYHFGFPGALVEVSDEDVQGLLEESDLRMVVVS